MSETPITPGVIALLGSGETSLAGGRVIEMLARTLPQPLRIAILETPAGFELNSAQVAGRVADFFRTRLQNYAPLVSVIPARKRGTPYSPDQADVLEPLSMASLIFMGPGSPTYAVRQLRGSLAWEVIRARHRMGAALLFSSAATIAIGQNVLPVYEIFKVGEDVSSPPGLDLFADFGMHLSFIPHWNNAEGGTDLDTSRCFIGIDRFAEWCASLSPEYTCIGLDEHTGLVIDFQAGKCQVNGVSSVTLLRECNPHIFPTGAVFPIEELGRYTLPKPPEAGISSTTWDWLSAIRRDTATQEEPPRKIRNMADERQRMRLGNDWPGADELRERIEAMGWQVMDTPDGTQLVRRS